MALLNSRSLINKFDLLQSLVFSKSLYVICITETWLNNQILDNEIIPQNYKIYRRDRESRGGGVLIAISEDINAKLVHTHTTVELIHIELDIKPTAHILCIYFSPSCSDSYLTI